MSDFLSKFNKGSYDPEKKPRSTDKGNDFDAPSEIQPDDKQETQQRSATEHESKTTIQRVRDEIQSPHTRKESNQSQNQNETQHSSVGTRRKDEETEFDPTYKKRKQKKQLLLIGAALLVLLIGGGTYYQLTHVTVPDFTGKELAEAREWAAKQNIKVELKQQYDDKVAANEVMSQEPKAKKKMKKGTDLKLTASSGADPEQQLTLPDFMALSKGEAEQWIADNQATNISIIEEYHETEESGKGLRSEFVNPEVTAENYRRKDKLKLYYSKGKETYTKNITVPDFIKKTKAEVESWAKTNDVEVVFEEVTSTEFAADTVIAQSIAKDEKIAKKEQIGITVSLGKGITVPYFGEYTIEEAQGAVEGLNIQVKTIFTESLGYGQLVSQSVEAGTELTAKDDSTVKVVYSAGQPYLKDLRGTTVEGDLQKLFYDEYQSKGAAIDYQIRYVDSVEAKGMVVGMSAHSLYVPLNYTVYLDISLGNLSGTPQYGSAGQSGQSGSQQGDAQQSGSFE